MDTLFDKYQLIVFSILQKIAIPIGLLLQYEVKHYINLYLFRFTECKVL